MLWICWTTSFFVFSSLEVRFPTLARKEKKPWIFILGPYLGQFDPSIFGTIFGPFSVYFWDFLGVFLGRSLGATIIKIIAKTVDNCKKGKT